MPAPQLLRVSHTPFGRGSPQGFRRVRVNSHLESPSLDPRLRGMTGLELTAVSRSVIPAKSLAPRRRGAGINEFSQTPFCPGCLRAGHNVKRLARTRRWRERGRKQRVAVSPPKDRASRPRMRSSRTPFQAGPEIALRGVLVRQRTRGATYPWAPEVTRLRPSVTRLRGAFLVTGQGRLARLRGDFAPQDTHKALLGATESAIKTINIVSSSRTGDRGIQKIRAPWGTKVTSASERSRETRDGRRGWTDSSREVKSRQTSALPLLVVGLDLAQGDDCPKGNTVSSRR